ncbi:Ig-like domain-containing protein, partial [Methylobacterium sp. A54F]
NDAPAGANMTLTFNEDTKLAFTAADFGFSDPKDSPANTLKSVLITTLPTAGTLSLGSTAVAAGQEILAADIARLSYQPAHNANGASYATLTFQVRDNGGMANGGVGLDPTPN